MNQTTVTQSVQNLLASEQQLLARKALAMEAVTTIDAELVKVRAAIQGIQLGQQLAAETAQAAPDAAVPVEPQSAPEA